MNECNLANWITAFATVVYAATVIWTLIYIKKQVHANNLMHAAGVLKEISEYIDKSHEFRKILYDNKVTIASVKNIHDLENFEKNNHCMYNAIYQVAHCYHHIGFLIKYHSTINKDAIVEEAGDTFLEIYKIIKSVIDLEREKTKKKTYKQYLEFFKKIVDDYKQKH